MAYGWDLTDGFMNVLFMLGNGFDLALGLATRYGDFFDWCWRRENGTVDLSSVREEIYTPAGNEFMLLVKSERKKLRDWNDFEKALELVTYDRMSSIKGASPGIYAANVVQFLQSAMRVYLSRENARILVSRNLQEKVSVTFKCALYKSIYRYIKSAEISEVNFLTFNYTNSLEQILCLCETKCGWHIHGSVEQNDMIVGIDDTKHRQFSEKMGEYYRMLVKSEQIKNGLGSVELERSAKKTIARSDLIVCYGLSFGDSDHRWWKRIRDLLLNNTRSRVLIIPYSPHVDAILANNRMRCMVRGWQNRMLRGMCRAQNFDKSELENEMTALEKLRDRILVADFGDCPSGDFWRMKFIGKMIVRPSRP